MERTSPTRTVLVVEDDGDMASLLALNLQRAGYRALVSGDGVSALKMIAAERPDMVLLDVMLPGMNGTDVASRIRNDPSLGGRATPIIMLTAKAEEVDQLVGLAVGADDYMTKPFSIKLLLARIEAVMRRTAGNGEGAPRRVRLDGLELDPETHEVTAGGRLVRLTLTEFRILAALLGSAPRVLTRRELLRAAMGPGITVTDRTIDVHVTAIRRKLGSFGGLIETVRGVGYRAAGGDRRSPENES